LQIRTELRISGQFFADPVGTSQFRSDLCRSDRIYVLLTSSSHFRLVLLRSDKLRAKPIFRHVDVWASTRRAGVNIESECDEVFRDSAWINPRLDARS
jgi:hypothetical protein